MPSLLEPNGKAITCIVPKGKTKPVLEALSEKGVTRFCFAFARGFDIHDPPKKNGMPAEVEKEILTVICKDSAEAEELFDFLYEKAKVNQLGGGLMTMSSLSGATPFLLPDLNNQSAAPEASAPGGQPEAPGPRP